MSKLRKNKYVIGVDGGGTKTVAALADLKGKILKTCKTGPSSPRNVGIEEAVDNIAKGINKLLNKNVVSIFAGLPAIQEEYRSKAKDIERKIAAKIKRKCLKIGTDQIVAFRSGTDESSGITVISGTGSSIHGWRGGRESKVSGWGWLADEGSAIWAGIEVLRAVLKDIDNRGERTELSRLVFKELKVSTPDNLVSKIYKEDFLQILASLSIVADYAGKNGDKTARMILRQAGEEVALGAETVVRNLGLQNQIFPLVLVGSMFKSDNFKNAFELYIRHSIPRARLIYPSKPPVRGAVKLAIESIK